MRNWWSLTWQYVTPTNVFDWTRCLVSSACLVFCSTIVRLWVHYWILMCPTSCHWYFECFDSGDVTVGGGGSAAAAPLPFRPGDPALCRSNPLVTPYYCRLRDLLCFVFMCPYCIFCVNCVIYVFLQYFDSVGWIFWPVKTVARVTYTVLVETLYPVQSNQSDVILRCSLQVYTSWMLDSVLIFQM